MGGMRKKEAAVKERKRLPQKSLEGECGYVGLLERGFGPKQGSMDLLDLLDFSEGTNGHFLGLGRASSNKRPRSTNTIVMITIIRTLRSAISTNPNQEMEDFELRIQPPLVHDPNVNQQKSTTWTDQRVHGKDDK